ncbi:hypothetical protein Pelo_9403 [Pelomyxa schiedti]|nr:hypothetical protein Pelo_9403 [Pelomyxa schiedti]
MGEYIHSRTVIIGGRAGDGNSTRWGSLSEWDEPGWGMRFYVDQDGVVSGGNSNESSGPQKRKTYTGTFRNNHLNVTSNHGVLYQADVKDGEMCTIYISHPTSGNALGKGRVTIRNGGVVQLN